MKKTILILLSLTLLLSFSACDTSGETETTTAANTVTTTNGADSNTAAPVANKATLYTVLGASNTNEYEFTYEESTLTPEIIAAALTEKTGLNFDISSSVVNEGSVVIDWKSTSTLIDGIGELEMKEDFTFYDADSLNWFMMNSLCKTILKNMDVDNVFYTMNGGEPLELNEMSPKLSLSPGIPYNNMEDSNVHVD